MAKKNETKATRVRSKGRARQAAKPRSDTEPRVLEEISIEELAIDGICGVY